MRIGRALTAAAAPAAALAGGAVRAVYPPQCLSCGALVGSDFGLCGPCWRETPFIAGAACAGCGQPVPAGEDEETALCEDCHQHPRPWTAGRSAMLYRDNGRRLVLALKHGDRMDLAWPMGRWLARAAQPLLTPDTLILPVPLHWWRLFRRQYNQAALLSRALAKATGLAHCPDALIRSRHTGSQEGRSREERHRAVTGAFRIHPRHAARIKDRPLLIVDDVMTSGATLAAATEACLAAGAGQVCVLALARVAKEA